MNKLILSIILTISTAYAGNTMVFPAQDIEALISKTGAYVLLRDIQDGFDELSGVTVSLEETIVLSPSESLDLSAILFTNDTELSISSTSRRVDLGTGGGH